MSLLFSVQILVVPEFSWHERTENLTVSFGFRIVNSGRLGWVEDKLDNFNMSGISDMYKYEDHNACDNCS